MVGTPDETREPSRGSGMNEITTGTEPVSIRKDAASLSLASLVRGYARTAVQATSLGVPW